MKNEKFKRFDKEVKFLSSWSVFYAPFPNKNKIGLKIKRIKEWNKKL